MSAITAGTTLAPLLALGRLAAATLPRVVTAVLRCRGRDHTGRQPDPAAGATSELIDRDRFEVLGDAEGPLQPAHVLLGLSGHEGDHQPVGARPAGPA